jgi:aryl-alcohol dehydrogenase-like predicted oxidoreductase
VKYLEENVRALDLRLSAEEMQRIDEVAPKGVTAGERYPDMSTVNR